MTIFEPGRATSRSTAGNDLLRSLSARIRHRVNNILRRFTPSGTDVEPSTVAGRPIPRADLLLVVASGTEYDMLRLAARERGIPFRERKNGVHGNFVEMGTVGNHETIAVKSQMGAIAHRGSVWKALRFQLESNAQGVILVGAAFGVDRARQRTGDVLVSRSVVPYDERAVVQDGASSYRIEIDRAKRRPARPHLLKLLEDVPRTRIEHGIQFGSLLSGGAVIRSETYRDELIERFADDQQDAIVGGEMEAVGLLALSSDKDPAWIVVKGISDFGDAAQVDEATDNRKSACLNASRLVLDALIYDATKRGASHGNV